MFCRLMNANVLKVGREVQNIKRGYNKLLINYLSAVSNINYTIKMSKFSKKKERGIIKKYFKFIYFADTFQNINCYCRVCSSFMHLHVKAI